MTRIKICGITNIEDARVAAHLGADFIGFIFYPPSARYIALESASEIVTQLHIEFGLLSPQFVGVFVDAAATVVSFVRKQVGLDLVQLHGDENVTVLESLQPGVYKALRPKSSDELKILVEAYGASLSSDDQTPHFLLDAYHPSTKGGTGQLADLDIATWLSKRYRLLLAGGLNPENVTTTIQAVRPWGVDVSSGVEIVRGRKLVKGCKDHLKVRAFIDAVRATSRYTVMDTEKAEIL